MRSFPVLVLVVVAAACASQETVLRAPPGGPSLFDRPWAWTDETGQAVQLSGWAGSTLVVSAFFTSCGRTCPLTVEKLRGVEEAYRAAGRQAEFVLITIDPGTDDPGALARYKREHHLPDAWHLLRGSAAQTEALTDLLDVHVLELSDHRVHSARIVVFDGRGAAALSFSCCNFDAAQAVL
jgi:cytochrome oxidase Cu insertion factor (SCO1/SenC/PrrC family)